MPRLISAVGGLWMRHVYRWRNLVDDLPVRPLDTPVAHASGVDPDCVFVVGNGLAVGWGVLTHDLAVPGQLARALSVATGRGSEVRIHADPSMTIATAVRSLSAVPMGACDAVIVFVGASDAFQLISVRRWRRHMDGLLDALEDAMGVHPVVIVGVSSPSGIPFFGTRPGGLIDRWAERLNSVTQSLCEKRSSTIYVSPVSRADLLPVPLEPSDDRYRGPEEYRQAALNVAHVLVPLLRSDESRRDHTVRGTAQTEDDRLAALRRTGILDSPPEERFDRIVRMARTMFGTESAAFTLIDEGRQWHKSAVGVSHSESPLDQSFCATTVQSATHFVVPDARHDDRAVPSTDVRFYAGYPIKAPDGVRIGAICVFDSRPRPAPTDEQLSFLRELAFRIERELAVLVS
ncbi:GAF domain-containing protein [Salinibacterium sp. G-O1]|uniref:GAF domain-containing protein n=1 Tax=Salinibacterium sp. G-O1 TaxID=3046208 RepID=UPI0024BA3D8A|nr:GAF domain-containing protein [Salinibacterium sp. G-O1]MDJ0334032.1 GAF domain-containing protein [Salinibacterium sp. G-O1]